MDKNRLLIEEEEEKAKRIVLRTINGKLSFEKGESPDWFDSKNSVGLEVSSVFLPFDVKFESLLYQLEKYFRQMENAETDAVRKKALKNYQRVCHNLGKEVGTGVRKGYIFFDFYSLLCKRIFVPHFILTPACFQRRTEEIINVVSKKCGKLNSKYRVFDENWLFIWTSMSYHDTRNDDRLFFDLLEAMSSYSVKFDKIYFGLLNKQLLLIFDFKNGLILSRHEPMFLDTGVVYCDFQVADTTTDKSTDKSTLM